MKTLPAPYAQFLHNLLPNEGLARAARYGHYEPARQMILNGATNLRQSFLVACQHGRVKIAKLLLPKVSKETVEMGFIEGCANGKIGIVNLTFQINLLSKGIYAACARGHTKILQSIASRYPISPQWVDVALVFAASAGHLDTVQFLNLMGACSANAALAVASNAGHLDVVKYLVEKCDATDYKSCLDALQNWPDRNGVKQYLNSLVERDIENLIESSHEE